MTRGSPPSRMEIRFGIEGDFPKLPGSIVCVGTFDGVHLGHQAVIRQCVTTAREAGLPAVLVTFDRHPAATLAPDRVPHSIGTLALNIERIAGLGIDLAVLLPFTRAFSQRTATEFFEEVLLDSLNSRTVVIGSDFGFGRGREGNAAFLQERIDTHVVEPVSSNGERISSSRIRRLLAGGAVAEAATLLGRPFEYVGVAVKGAGLGARLGFPTANLAPLDRQALPPDGVYAGSCLTPKGEFRAAISIGSRPTVGGTEPATEAFLLDYPGGDLYGAVLRLRFDARLRDQCKFSSLEELIEQMRADVERITSGEF